MLSIASNVQQGEGVLAEVSEDSGTTWLKLVCLIKQGFETTRAVNKTPTQCGVQVGLGPLDNSVPLEGAINTDPAAGYASYSKMQEWIDDGTALMFRQVMDNDLYNGISCYLTDLKLDIPVDDIAKFSGTLTGFGARVRVNPVV